MKLIIKYGVADYSKTEKLLEESQKDEFNETVSSRVSRMFESTTAATEDSKIDFNQEADDEEEESGPEDDEAFLINERKKIDEAIKLCEDQFVKKKPKEAEPIVVKKLGVGLAAAVNHKLSESRKLYLQELSDDSNFYDDESDTSEKRRFPDLVSEAQMEDYYDEEEEPEEEQEEEASNELKQMEREINMQKVQVLRAKIDEEYSKGFKGQKDVNKLLNMQTLRLTFLDIGP